VSDLAARTTALGAWIFPAPGRAGEALRTVERLQVTGAVAVEDAALVDWERGRARPEAYQVGTAAGTSALSGAFWGLLFGVALLLPLAGQTGVGLPGIGLSLDVLELLRARIVPGTSALFLLTPDVPRVGAALDHRDPVLGTLDASQESALRTAFGADL
jgi:uncharacterized membrane protein